MNNCKKCNSELSGNYCCNCGQPAKLKRIDSRYIITEIRNLLYFEKGFFYTIKELLIRPGKSVREFISESRYRLVKPITFLLLSSLIYTILNIYLDIESNYTEALIGENDAAFELYNLLMKNLGYLNLGVGIIVAFWTKIFFKKYGYNFFEILILLCFLLGIEMLISSFFGIIEGVTNIQLMYFAWLVGFGYRIWATGQFFANKSVNYFKAFLASVLGLFSFFIIGTIFTTIALLIMQA